tara:strand:+ start:381 stop:539 length:159 start_codon:yes stop_codon:yes gene_type:complete
MAIRTVIVDDIELEYLRIFLRDDHEPSGIDMWAIVDDILQQIIEEEEVVSEK